MSRLPQDIDSPRNIFSGELLSKDTSSLGHHKLPLLGANVLAGANVLGGANIRGWLMSYNRMLEAEFCNDSP